MLHLFCVSFMPIILQTDEAIGKKGTAAGLFCLTCWKHGDFLLKLRNPISLLASSVLWLEQTVFQDSLFFTFFFKIRQQHDMAPNSAALSERFKLFTITLIDCKVIVIVLTVAGHALQWRRLGLLWGQARRSLAWAVECFRSVWSVVFDFVSFFYRGFLLF